MARVNSVPPKGSLLAALGTVLCLLTLVWVWPRRPRSLLQSDFKQLCPHNTAANITDRLNTMWLRKGPAYTGTPLSNMLGTVDRVDVYHGLSNTSDKSTVLFAYRHSACVDWNRENPDKLFANNVFSTVLPSGGVTVDIGACYGDTSVPLAVRADMVIAFEPNPFSYRVLELNALLNPGLNIRTHNLAAGDGKVADLSFTYGGDMCNGGIMGNWKDASQETRLTVKAVDVSSFLLQEYGEDVVRRIRVVKIDAEGFDSSIIHTLKPLLRYTKFILLVEWFDYYVTSPPHGNEGSDGVHPGAKALFDAIAALGYTPYNPETGARVSGPQNKNKIPDLLCKPE